MPTVKQVLPQLVAKVDADGNEMAGVKSPLQMAPLGTYTGWNVMSSGAFKGQMCLFASPVGGFIPFARRRRSGCQRRSAAVAGRAVSHARRLRAGGRRGRAASW